MRPLEARIEWLEEKLREQEARRLADEQVARRQLRCWQAVAGALAVTALVLLPLRAGVAEGGPPGGGNASLAQRVQALEAKLEKVSVRNIDGHYSLVIEGANLHLRSGLGATNGLPSAPYDTDERATNGLGNLVIGYNESRVLFGEPDERSGSHNLVIGLAHKFTGHSGIVAGYNNAITANYAAVTVGGYNVASGSGASVSGGWRNTASGDYASVSGGDSNTASGFGACVSGGSLNTASGAYYPVVTGGQFNISSGSGASVTAGSENVASGDASSVSGGAFNVASQGVASVSAGLRNTASGFGASVSGGERNTAALAAGSVSGGHGIVQPDVFGWAAGGSYSPGTGPGVFHVP